MREKIKKTFPRIKGAESEIKAEITCYMSSVHQAKRNIENSINKVIGL